MDAQLLTQLDYTLSKCGGCVGCEARRPKLLDSGLSQAEILAGWVDHRVTADFLIAHPKLWKLLAEDPAFAGSETLP